MSDYEIRPKLTRTILYVILRDLRLIMGNKTYFLNALLFCLSYLLAWYFIVEHRSDDMMMLSFILSIVITFSMLIGENYVITTDYENGQLEMLMHTGHSFAVIMACKFVFYIIAQCLVASCTLLVFFWLFDVELLWFALSTLLFVVLVAGNLFMFFAMRLGYESKFMVSLLSIPINLPYTLLFLLSLNEHSYLLMMSGLCIALTPVLVYCSSLIVRESIADR